MSGKSLPLIKVVCFSRLLKCLRSLYGKQCGPRSDCSFRSSLFWIHAVCFCNYFVSNVRQLFAADDFSRRHFQMIFFLDALRVKNNVMYIHFICLLKYQVHRYQVHRLYFLNKIAKYELISEFFFKCILSYISEKCTN